MSSYPNAKGASIRKDDSRRLEDESRKMEQKMQMLRKAMEGDDSNRSSRSGGDSSRWRSGTDKKPLRGDYVKGVLEAKPTRTSMPKQPNYASGVQSLENCLPGMQSLGGMAADSSSARGQTTSGQAASGQTTPKQADASQLPKEAREVGAFLAGLGLDRYVSLFMEHGFDDMEVVQMMEESHMRDIGMATGHALKLKKKLADLNPAPAPTPLAPPVSALKKPAVHGNGAGTDTGGGGLLDGDFDEEQEKASFQEAVRAWREGRDPVDAVPKAAPSPGGAAAGFGGDSLLDSQFEEEEAKAGFSEAARAWREGRSAYVPGSFWSKLGEDKVNLERCSTPLTTPAGTRTSPKQAKPAGTTTSPKHDPAPGETKLCCYQCYKQFHAHFAVERCSPLPDRCTRRLCSEACADVWIACMNAKAEEMQQRQEKLAKLEEAKRSMDYEQKTSPFNTGAEPTA